MPDLTRRAALILGAGAGLLAISSPADAATTAIARTGQLRLTLPAIGPRSSFTRVLGTVLTASNDRARYQLRLLTVRDLPGAPAADRAQSFNLIFENVRDVARTANVEDVGSGCFVEGIYQLFSPRLRSTRLLVSPIGPAGDRQQLQALINRS